MEWDGGYLESGSNGYGNWAVLGMGDRVQDFLLSSGCDVTAYTCEVWVVSSFPSGAVEGFGEFSVMDWGQVFGFEPGFNSSPSWLLFS